MQNQIREAQTLWVAWINLSILDYFLCFQFDAQSPTIVVVLPAYTMYPLRELHNQLGHIGRNKLESQQDRDSGQPTYEGTSRYVMF